MKDDGYVLTKRQEEILIFVGNESTKNCIPPTLREVGEACGIRSTNGVNDHYRALERKGFLMQQSARQRGVCLTDIGWEYVEVFNMFGSMAR